MAVKKKAKKPAKKKAATKAKPKARKKAAAKKPVIHPARIGGVKEKKLGEVLHFFNKISVAAIKVKAPFKVGDIIHIKGHTTDFDQTVQSMQIEHAAVQVVKKGDDVGIVVKDHVREGDGVFLK